MCTYTIVYVRIKLQSCIYRYICAYIEYIRIQCYNVLQYYILIIPTNDSSTNIELVWIGDLQVWCFHAWMCVAGFARSCRLRICSLIDRSSGEGFTDRFLRRRWWCCDLVCVLKPDRTWQNIQKAIAAFQQVCTRAGLMLLIDYYTPADEKWTLSTFGWCPDMWKSHKITFHWSNLSTWFRMWAKATLVVGPIHWWLSSQHIPNLKYPNRKKQKETYYCPLSSFIIYYQNFT